MTALLLDVDGVLHVSGRPVEGAVEALARLRADGHRLRLVTNTTTRPRRVLAEELAGMGFEVVADEIEMPAPAAARALAGRRVLALVMPALASDLQGVELVEEGADAVLLGGLDEPEAASEVLSYPRLDRAFAALMDGAELFALHRNRWWQTAAGPRLDVGAFVDALEAASGRTARVFGKPGRDFFTAALDALGAAAADTVMVGDDLRSDVGAAQSLGMAGVLVRTGKFRPAQLEEEGAPRPDAVLDSIAELPRWLAAGPGRRAPG
jgi:HAD superfamily hydrolase (TIGR01458 family)